MVNIKKYAWLTITVLKHFDNYSNRSFASFWRRKEEEQKQKSKKRLKFAKKSKKKLWTNKVVQLVALKITFLTKKIRRTPPSKFEKKKLNSSIQIRLVKLWKRSQESSFLLMKFVLKKKEGDEIDQQHWRNKQWEGRPSLKQTPRVVIAFQSIKRRSWTKKNQLVYEFMSLENSLHFLYWLFWTMTSLKIYGWKREVFGNGKMIEYTDLCWLISLQNETNYILRPWGIYKSQSSLKPFTWYAFGMSNQPFWFVIVKASVAVPSGIWMTCYKRNNSNNFTIQIMERKSSIWRK